MKQRGNIILGILIGLLIAGGLFGVYYLGTRNNKPKIQNPVITSQTPQSTPSLTPDETANWKTYTNDIFSFQYPNNWYVNKYKGSSNFAYFVQVSDVENSYTVIQGMSDTHTRIDIGNNANPIPSSFPYTNGSSANNTIKPFSINVLGGIQGQETSTAGLVDVVYLQNPKGGYVSLQLTPPTNSEIASKQIFNQLLATFKFTDKNQANVDGSIGTVTGKLCYPSSLLPKGIIEAKSVSTGKIYAQDYPGSKNGGGFIYTFNLPPDQYYLRYNVAPNLIGYHTTICATGNETTCGDTKLRVLTSIQITLNQTAQGYDLCDFYYTSQNAPTF